jgi:hypothetical protein
MSFPQKFTKDTKTEIFTEGFAKLSRAVTKATKVGGLRTQTSSTKRSLGSLCSLRFEILASGHPVTSQIEWLQQAEIKTE